jgi:hypothetical protein
MSRAGRGGGTPPKDDRGETRVEGLQVDVKIETSIAGGGIGSTGLGVSGREVGGRGTRRGKVLRL